MEQDLEEHPYGALCHLPSSGMQVAPPKKTSICLPYTNNFSSIYLAGAGSEIMGGDSSGDLQSLENSGIWALFYVLKVSFLLLVASGAMHLAWSSFC